MAPPPGPLAISASPRVHALLARLHAASAAQEKSLSQVWFYLKRFITFYISSSAWGPAADDHMRDKFVALEEDKCHFVYLLARSSGALNIVEAGTSFGVSTIYLALAVGQNVADQKALGRTVNGKVIATEKEPTKAARAREHWAEAGDEVAGVIELREGDLLETLKRDDMPEQVDFLLLDIWTPMALPTLQIIKPRLKKGAIVLADNTKMARPLYAEYLDYIQNPANGFKTTEIPYSGGLQMSVYLPE
ncbi:S-adenosyl-L-methionine-dependent methyltransferase [Parathielavia appendiculata]|uniref:S-adenosyl-L-methionine-dependent methyltransferase n=1 Tax=Parathielavia appendiculata TaxID=2587402 RepID=A0AAN6TSH9_9PEZI|nr:S-adenosyl-L-methionine-dependent methyltransferase [Parathielavia appendiculata]